MNTNNPMIFNMESNTSEARLRRGLRSVISTHDPEFFWSEVPESPRPDRNRNAFERHTISELFYSSLGQRGSDVSFQNASPDSRNRWIVEEWIFAIAVIKASHQDRVCSLTVGGIISQIRWIRSNGRVLDWDAWIEEQRRWIDGPPR
jgi:hypothetical protein